MRIARTAAIVVLTAALALAGCSGRLPTSPSAPATPAPVIPVIAHGRVAIISIDGLRPDAIQIAGAANILALAARGAFTWNAQTIYPSNTLPAHISMLSGYAPEEHGVTWDDYLPSRGPILVPTIFASARAKGLRTGMVVGKEKFTTFRDTGACDTWVLAAPDDDDVAGRIPLALVARPDLLFVHLPDVDLVGHASRWMSDAYLAAVRRADAAVGRIVASLSPDTTVILTADHGGRPEGHGSDSPFDTTIPWVIAGPSTAKGKVLSNGISTLDTAATAAFVLGVSLQPGAQGRPVYDAFVSKPQGLTAQASSVTPEGLPR
jgi:arylsulfatase A-like enzyme